MDGLLSMRETIGVKILLVPYGEIKKYASAGLFHTQTTWFFFLTENNLNLDDNDCLQEISKIG